MRKKSLVELRKYIEADIETQQQAITLYGEDKNPQVQELYFRAVARQEALEDVLEYIKNGITFRFEVPEDVTGF